MSDEEKKEQAFKFTDKRRFGKDGEIKDAEKGPETTPKEAPEGAPQEGSAGDEETQKIPIGEISFSNFIVSLSSVALMNLGEFPDPGTQKIEKNIRMAKYHIDLLEVLQQKTKGNLDKDEEELFENILYHLRMKYVQAMK